MVKRHQPVDGYTVFLGRFASYVVHNELNDNRAPIESALKSYLQEVVGDFKPRVPIYYAHPYNHKGVDGALGLVFAADDPSDKPRYIMVLAVQLPVSPASAQPGTLPNCHWTTEIYPAESHSLIPVTCEFARATVPAKRLNFVVSHKDNSCARLDDSMSINTGFKHFISVAYSQYGLAYLDFQLTVAHGLSVGAGAFPVQELVGTKEDFLAVLRREITCPLKQIREELEEDKHAGALVPREMTRLGTFFNKLADQVVEQAYANLVIFKQELDSHVNPTLHRTRYGHNIVVPLPEQVIAERRRIAHTLVHSPGALELIYMLADVGPIELDNDQLGQAVPAARILEVLEALQSTGLVDVTENLIELTERGVEMVEKLRAALYQKEGSGDGVR